MVASHVHRSLLHADDVLGLSESPWSASSGRSAGDGSDTRHHYYYDPEDPSQQRVRSFPASSSAPSSLNVLFQPVATKRWNAEMGRDDVTSNRYRSSDLVDRWRRAVEDRSRGYFSPHSFDRLAAALCAVIAGCSPVVLVIAVVIATAPLNWAT